MNNLKSLLKGIVTILIVLFAVPSVSQTSALKDYIRITGKIVDSETGMPIAFASVTVDNTQTGTVANTEGEFTIQFEKSVNAKYLAFKYIGYKNKKVAIKKIPQKNFTVELSPSVISIDEVIVRPGDAEVLIKEVLAKIPENYGNKPYKEMAFYREYVKKKRRYVSVSEAVVEIYKAPYDKIISEDAVKLYKGHKSAKVKTQDTLIMKLRGGPKTALMLDIAKNPDILFSEDFLELYDFRISNITNIDDRQNYILLFKQKSNPEYPLFNGKLYIDVKTLAITAAEFSLNLENPEAASRIFVRKKPLFMTIRPVNTKYLVNYAEDNGIYYFSHARGEVEFEIKWKRKLFKSHYSVMTEIAITDRTDKNVQKIPRSKQLKSNIIFDEKVVPFSDKDFWGKYNTIKPEESIEKTIKKYGVRLKIQEN